MIVTGEHTFPGTRQSVWTLLQDPEVLVKAMPGARRLTITGDGTYEGVVRIGVGPVTAAEWKLNVELHDREEPVSYVMHVDTKGPLGFTRGTATVALVEVDEGTRMLYHADLSVGGKVASVGQRLLDQVAKMLTKQGLNALNKEMEARLLNRIVVEDWVAPEDGDAENGDGAAAVEIRDEMPDDALPGSAAWTATVEGAATAGGAGPASPGGGAADGVDTTAVDADGSRDGIGGLVDAGDAPADQLGGAEEADRPDAGGGAR